MLNSPYITFSDALNKWAKQAQFIEDSFFEIRDKAIESYKNLRDIYFSDYGNMSYILEKFDKDRSSQKASTFSIYVKEKTNYNRVTNEFLNSLILKEMDCFLKDLNYNHRKCPYLIFYYHRKNIIESNGYINIDTVRHEVCFEKNAFNAFLYAEKSEYKIIIQIENPLDSLSHIPEYRLIKEGIAWPLEEVKRMHTEKHDPEKQQSKLFDKLKQLEPSLNDEWARNISTLLHKRDI